MGLPNFRKLNKFDPKEHKKNPQAQYLYKYEGRYPGGLRFERWALTFIDNAIDPNRDRMVYFANPIPRMLDFIVPVDQMLEIYIMEKTDG